MPSSSRRGSRAGAPGSYTDLGAPDRISALASWARTVAGSTSQGTTSENTWHSRTRRAMSWAYWAPKSSTRTVSCPGAGVVMGRRIPGRGGRLLARLEEEYLERERGDAAPLVPRPRTAHRNSGVWCVFAFRQGGHGDRARGDR